MAVVARVNASLPKSHPRILLISGVRITPAEQLLKEGRPRQDYIGVLDTLKPDILDLDSIAQVRHPLVRLILRTHGPRWAIPYAAMLNAHRYDAIVAAAEDVGLSYALLRRIFRVRTPLLSSMTNVGTRRPAFLLGKLKLHSAIDTFLCLSKTQARILAEEYGVPESKLCVTSYSIDDQHFQPMPEVPVKRQICSAGMAQRDYATLIEATRGMDIKIVIDANSAWWKQDLNIAQEKLPENVEVRFGQTTRALRQLYAESLFVVLPLLDVPYGVGYTVNLEAMAMGKTVIVSKLKQHGDFVIDGENGFYVPPQDAGALRSRIQYLLDHPEEAERLGRSARRTVETQFTVDHYAERFVRAVKAKVTSRDKVAA